MVFASKNDLVVNVFEDFIQISSELSNARQMDISFIELRTKKSGQLELLETS